MPAASLVLDSFVMRAEPRRDEVLTHGINRAAPTIDAEWLAWRACWPPT